MLKAKKKTQIRRKKIVKLKIACFYCKSKLIPDYKSYEDIARFLSDRGQIVGKERSGLCAKHQKKLAVGIKRARYLGLLPFRVSL